ncbi:MAG: hypothetical protein ACKO90_16305, partial [Microcystis panniformis]
AMTERCGASITILALKTQRGQDGSLFKPILTGSATGICFKTCPRIFMQASGYYLIEDLNF